MRDCINTLAKHKLCSKPVHDYQTHTTQGSYVFKKTILSSKDCDMIIL